MTNRKAHCVKSYVVNGTRYNSLRYPGQPLVSLPNDLTIPQVMRTPEYKAAMRAAKTRAALEQPREKGTKKDGPSLREAVDQYYATDYYKEALRRHTQQKRRYVLEAFCNGRGGQRGKAPLSKLSYDLFNEMIQEIGAKKPHAARNLLIAFRHVCWVRVQQRLMKEEANPTRGVKLGKTITKRFGHFKTWEEQHVQGFRRRWQHGTMERLAFEIMIHTGMAVADVIRMTRGWIERSGVIRYNRMKTGTEARPFMTRELRAAIEACPLTSTVDEPFVPMLRDSGFPPHGDRMNSAPGKGKPWWKVGPDGQPLRDKRGEIVWNNVGFSHWFSDACRAAGIPTGFSAHGLRSRAAACDALGMDVETWELTREPFKTRELMSKFGWKDMAEAELYTRMAEDELQTMKRAKEAAGV